MKRNLLKTMLVAVGMVAGMSGAWAQEQEETWETKVVKSWTFTGLSATVDVVVDGTQSITENKISCNLVTSPENCKGIYVQGSWKCYKNNDGLRNISSGGRMVIIPNLKAGDVILIETNNTDYISAPKYEITVNEGKTEATSTMQADGNFYFSFTKQSNTAWPSLHGITVSRKVSTNVEKPTGSITNVNGKSRTATFTTETIDATLLKSDTENGTYTEFDGTITVEETTTVYVKASLNGIESEPLEYTIEAGEEVKLNKPEIVKTAWNNGITTYSIKSNQNDVLLAPNTTTVCSDPNVSVSNNSVSLLAGTYTFHVEASGYLNSDNVVITVIDDRAMTLVEKVNYEDICASYNAKVSLNTESSYNDGSRDYYSFAYVSEYSEEAKEDRLLTNYELVARSGFGLQNQYSGTKWVAITGLKAGQIIKFICGNTGGNAYGFVPTESSKAVVANEATASVPVIEVLQDGTIAFTIGRLSYIKGFEIYALDPVEISVGDAGLATFCSNYALDFTNVENIWAYRAKLSGDKVTLVRAKGVVNAGEGILLRSLTEDAQTANVPVTSESSTERNDFVGTVEAKHIDPTEGNNTNYVLAKVNGELCFSTIADGGITLRANSAYLPVPSSTAKSIRMVFGDDVTGINDVKTDAVKDNEVFYTLSGVRVLNPTKGLYIQNGKKVVIK